MTTNPTPAVLDVPKEFLDTYNLQRAAYLKNMNPTLKERQDDLRALHRMVADNADDIVAAINADYGCRCAFETRFAEVYMAQESALDTIKKVKKWVRPQRRHLDPTQYPLAKAWTFPQPVGVVGVVVPWNFPLAMAIQPLICAFAAGNRAMIKMSENSNNLALLLKKISPKYFPADKLAFFEDANGRGPAFTTLPFDHIFFTGSPTTGKAVMANAARNLTPVTLELGGKSPCIIAPDYSPAKAAHRILWAKMLNAGQICTNVDYILMPADKVDEFIAECKTIFNTRIPDINNGDYTAVIDQRSHDRLEGMLTEATSRGARVVDLYTGPAPKAGSRLMPTKLVLNAPDDTEIMQREIFGPLLPILTYKTKEEALAYINARPRPLALYLYSDDSSLQDYVLNNTISGGVGLNESVIQAGLHDLPFGGSGNSGMGHYHGYEGFATFSKLRPVFKQGGIRALDLFLPPYAGWPSRILGFMMNMKK
jgi:coniferyl-aldehyde dehydrogenase